MPERTCSIDDCNEPREYQRLLCSGHRHRKLRYGDPLAPLHFRRVTGPIEERLWAKIDTSGTSQCWEWQGSRKPNGYGQILVIPDHGPRRVAYTHRLAWELFYGPIPPDLYVLHRCDNRPCCRPQHLFLGTHVDNMADMAAKGRAAWA